MEKYFELVPTSKNKETTLKVSTGYDLGGTTWPLLCEAGYAENGEVFHHENSKDATMYWLTRKGLDWLGAQLGIVIHDEWK